MSNEDRSSEANERRVASVSNAIRILNLLASHQSGLGVSEIARTVGLGKSTVHTLLATLRAEEYVEKSPDGSKYHLGLGAFHIGAAAVPGVPADGRLMPLLWTLAEETGEAVSLAIAHHADAVIVQRIESQRLLRAEIRVGTRMPLHSSASGKSLLSQMSDDTIRSLYPHDELPQLSPDTISSRDALLAELDQVRQRGHAVNRGEYAGGVIGVATWVRGRGNRAPLALSVAGPSHRFDPEPWVGRLKEIAKAMGETLA